MSCTVLCASAQFARRSSGRRAAFSSWHPARQRAIRLRIHGERRKARCFRDAAGSLPKQTLAATPETLAPSAASGGAANCLLHCGTRVPRACGAEPSTVRRHRKRPAPRPPSLATLQAFTSPASRHSFNPASPRRHRPEGDGKRFGQARHATSQSGKPSGSPWTAPLQAASGSGRYRRCKVVRGNGFLDGFEIRTRHRLARTPPQHVDTNMSDDRRHPVDRLPFFHVIPGGLSPDPDIGFL